MDPPQFEEHLKFEMGVQMAHHLVKDEGRRIPYQRPAQ